MRFAIFSPPVASAAILGAAAVSKMACISRGTPGMAITVAPPRRTANPGASPAGLPRTSAPPGTRTWRMLFGVSGAPVLAKRAFMCSSAGGWTTGATPSASAMTSTVRSSSVGPSPPEQTTSSARAVASASARSMSGRSSRQLVIQITVTPSSHNLAAIQEEFVSTISPRQSSSPMVRISACIDLPLPVDIIARPSPTMKIRYAAKTDVGMKRNHNEDYFSLIEDEQLFIVADGMGGHASGEVASKLAAETVGEFYQRTKDEDATWPYKMDRSLSYIENRLVCGIKLANYRIYEA